MVIAKTGNLTSSGADLCSDSHADVPRSEQRADIRANTPFDVDMIEAVVPQKRPDAAPGAKDALQKAFAGLEVSVSVGHGLRKRSEDVAISATVPVSDGIRLGVVAAQDNAGVQPVGYNNINRYTKLGVLASAEVAPGFNLYGKAGAAATYLSYNGTDTDQTDRGFLGSFVTAGVEYDVGRSLGIGNLWLWGEIDVTEYNQVSDRAFMGGYGHASIGLRKAFGPGASNDPIGLPDLGGLASEVVESLDDGHFSLSLGTGANGAKSALLDYTIPLGERFEVGPMAGVLWPGKQADGSVVRLAMAGVTGRVNRDDGLSFVTQAAINYSTLLSEPVPNSRTEWPDMHGLTVGTGFEYSLKDALPSVLADRDVRLQGMVYVNSRQVPGRGYRKGEGPIFMLGLSFGL